MFDDYKYYDDYVGYDYNDDYDDEEYNNRRTEDLSTIIKMLMLED